jgi:hypothetical protein
MNAAEITDKLGLHSLRQRAWVRNNEMRASRCLANKLPVHPVYLRHIRRRSVRGSRVVEQLAPQGRPQLSYFAHVGRSNLHLPTSAQPRRVTPKTPLHGLSPAICLTRATYMTMERMHRCLSNRMVERI